MTVNAANLYSAAQGEGAAAAKRAAEVRRKLLKSEAGIEAGASHEETLLIGQWLDGNYSRMQSEDQYHAAAAGKNWDLG